MKFQIGDLVRVKNDVTTPYCGWGCVNRGSVGRVVSISSFDMLVDFPEQPNWMACSAEMEPMHRSTVVFDEDKLGEEIARTWGLYGAHMEVYNMLRKQVADLKAELEKLRS